VKHVGASEIARLALALVFFVAAPTAGDIGSCGQSADDLDPQKFFQAKANLDCSRCGKCGIDTQTCRIACTKPPQTSFPDGCFPLVHDGEVCLDALEAAGCGDYAKFEADQSPTSPTECNFCPPGEGP
jgi:hypothetical protein